MKMGNKQIYHNRYCLSLMFFHSIHACLSQIIFTTNLRLISNSRALCKRVPSLTLACAGLLEPTGSRRRHLVSTFKAENFIRRLSWSIFSTNSALGNIFLYYILKLLFVYFACVHAAFGVINDRLICSEGQCPII